MADERRRVSEKLAAEVMFEADCVCCICQRADRRLQIHHIDGDPSNSSKDNLAALCLECHDRVSVAGGTGRRLGPSLVRKYKEDWLRVVERKRSGRLPPEPAAAPVSDDKLTEAVAVVEVRKIAYSVPGVPGSWAGVAEHISPLANYGRDFGATVKSEVLSAVYPIACYTRAGMPEEVASTMVHVLHETLPLPFFALHEGSSWLPSDQHLNLLKRGSHVAGTLAYDGAKYLRNLRIVDAGGDVLRAVLKYSSFHGIEELKTRCLEDFDTALNGAKDAGFGDASLWLEFLREDAFARTDWDRPALPNLDGPYPWAGPSS